VIGPGRTESEFVKDARDVLLHRSLADQQRLSDATVGLPFRHRRQHIALPRAEPVKRLIAFTPTEHPRDDLRVKRATAPGDPGDRVDEALDVPDALLEQVADSVGAVPDQIDRIPLLVVQRQHQHPGLRPLTPEFHGRLQAVITVARRHVDVDDHHRRTVREPLAQQILGVASLGDDLESGLGQQSRDSLAQQHVVLADHHSQRA
jgi:hypothetical protein